MIRQPKYMADRAFRMCVVALGATLATLAGARETLAQAWLPQVTGTTAEFRGLDAADSLVVWAGARGGVYARTADGGLTWHSGHVPGADSLFFIDAHAVDARTAYLLGTDFNGGHSRIYRTDDAGASWQLQFERSGAGVFFDGFAFWDDAHGVAFSDPVAGTLLVVTTDDGGATWRDVPREALPPILEGEAGFAASGRAIVTSGESVAWIGTGGGELARVWKTEDRGRTWRAVQTPLRGGASAGVFAVAFGDSLRGVAVGGDHRAPRDTAANVLLSEDGGATWRLAGASAPAGVRYGAAFVPGTNVVVAVGPSGTGNSLDGGRSWRTIGDEAFNTVAFVSPRHGWAAGTDGRISKWSGELR